MTVLEHLADLLHTLVREDPRRVILGEDVREGGMLGLTRPIAADETLRERLLGLPLSSTGGLAHATGLALGGARPIVVLDGCQRLLEGAAALREAAELPWRSAGTRTVPLCVLVPIGAGFGFGADGGDAALGLLARLPGVRVNTLGRAHEVGARLRQAADFLGGEDPTVLLMPRQVLLQDVEDGAWIDEPSTDDDVRWLRDGAQATIFAWGEAVGPALEAVETSGVDAGVVELGRLVPTEAASLAEAARRTGKIVIVHAGARGFGLGAELAALFSDQAIFHLDAPVLRVTGADGPIDPRNEATMVPTVPQIARALAEVVSP